MAESGDHDAYADGVEHLLGGELALAVERLTAIAATDPRVEPRLALGKAQLARGDAPAAAETFRTILSGERAPGRALRAYVLLLAARAAVAAGRAPDVEPIAAEAESLDPRLAPALRRLRDRSGEVRA